MFKIKLALFTGIVFAAAFILSCSSDDNVPSGNEGNGNDIRKYRIATMGGKNWMAENLNYAVKGSKCYGNLDSNCVKYGRLYDWATAMALDTSCNTKSCVRLIQSPHQGICPDAWHIPSKEDWNALIDSAGGASIAGKHLKATSGWNSYNSIIGNGTDQFKFAALPGGYGTENGNFENIGFMSRWWSTRDDGSNNADAFTIHFDRDVILMHGYEETLLFSVRCVQD